MIGGRAQLAVFAGASAGAWLYEKHTEAAQLPTPKLLAAATIGTGTVAAFGAIHNALTAWQAVALGDASAARQGRNLLRSDITVPLSVGLFIGTVVALHLGANSEAAG